MITKWTRMSKTYYNRALAKKTAEQDIRDYFNTAYVADEVTLGPYCSKWVHEEVEKRKTQYKTMSELEEIAQNGTGKTKIL